MVGVVIQRCPDLPDCIIQSLFEINEGVCSPDFADDLFARDDLAGSRRQQKKNPGGLRLQLQGSSPAR